MAAAASLNPTAVTVEPGGTASCSVKVRNTGTVVDEMSFEVLGEAAAWTTVAPPVLRLFPGAEGEAVVTFAPPRSADVGAGTTAFAIKVTPKEDPYGSTVEEGSVTVSAHIDLGAELRPRTGKGRKGARFELAVDNRGNREDVVTFLATDAEEALGYSFSPPNITAGPGTATFVKVLVRPEKRFRRGPAKSHPFKVVAQPREGAPVSVDGMYVQEPLIADWLAKAALAVAALVLVLVILWFTVLKPVVKSAAKDAVAAPLADQQAQLNKVARAVGVSPSSGGGAAGGAAGGGTGAGGGAGTGSGGGATGTLSILGNPTDGRLSVSAPAHNAPPVTSDFTVPSGKTLSITDIVLENSQGDTGTLVIRRNDAVLMSVQLANFRDLDYHFVAPLVFKADDKLTIALTCDGPGAPATSCNDAVFYAGYIV